jgi:uncharacterized protein
MSLGTKTLATAGFVLRLPQRILIGVVQAYRLLLSPWLGSGCRFSPTCSAYALSALERQGAAYGSALAVWRIARCHPWCAGGLDPVPEQKRAVSKHLFTSLLIKKSP